MPTSTAAPPRWVTCATWTTELIVLLRPARAPPADAGLGAARTCSTASAGSSRRSRRAAYAAARWSLARTKEARAALDELERPGRVARSRARPARLRSWPSRTRRVRARAEENELVAERARLRNQEGPAGGRRWPEACRRPRFRRFRSRARPGGGRPCLAEAGRELDALQGVDARLDGLGRARPSAALLELEDVGAGPARLRARRVEGDAGQPGGGRGAPGRSSTVSSASTAARWRRCSSTRSAAGRGAESSWPGRRWRSRARRSDLEAARPAG